MRRAILALLIVSTLLTVPAVSQKRQQADFGIESPVNHPVKLPNAVLRMLSRDERVRGCLRDDSDNGRGIRKWFIASAFDLNNGDRTDFIVKPEAGCLMGANIGPFWVFRSTARGYDLALKTHTLGLSILREVSNGYRDINVEAASATTIYGSRYKFNGRRYVPSACWEQSIDGAQKGRNGKVTYYRCPGDDEKPYR